MPALALTDHGAMYGAIEFYLAAKAAGIKPIIGVRDLRRPAQHARPGGRGQVLRPSAAAGQGLHRLPEHW